MLNKFFFILILTTIYALLFDITKNSLFLKKISHSAIDILIEITRNKTIVVFT